MKSWHVWPAVQGMVVVAGILAIVGGIGYVVRRAAERAQVAQCQNNMRNVALALQQYKYTRTKDAFPPATYPNASLPVEQRLSWIVSISMFLDYCGLYGAFDRTAPWDSRENAHLAETRIGVVQCPALRSSEPSGLTQYVGITGLGTDSAWLPAEHPRAGVFGYERGTRPADIKDGLSATMMLAETALANGPWTRGGPATARGLDPDRKPYIGRGRQFGGTHRGVLVVAFADGSVRSLSETIAPNVFEALSTIAGGETLPPEWDR